MKKYIFVTGGVVSSLGKGIASASIGTMLEASGLKVNFIKLDPYLNMDPGTMNPFEHGEVFVTDDGYEADLDLGHYERFTNVKMSANNNLTSGKLFHDIIQKERQGGFLGQTVQIIPHLTDHIQASVEDIPGDVIIVEIGGTVGDIEGLPFLEAIRQMRLRLGVEHTMFIHLTLVPYIASSQEIKTKPTQHSVKELRSIGIQPDVIMCRCEQPLSQEQKDKIALFTNVPNKHIISLQDVTSVYQIPQVLLKQHVDHLIFNHFKLPDSAVAIDQWAAYVAKEDQPEHVLHIGIVGKYSSYVDAYKSLVESLKHAAVNQSIKPHIHFIDSDRPDDELIESLKSMHGFVIAGGFGERGIEGKLMAIQYARENHKPILGICLGFQLMVIEFMRHVCGISGANSTEFDANCKEPVIATFDEWADPGLLASLNDKFKAKMQLGLAPIALQDDSLVHHIYSADVIQERHRHRYGINPAYEAQLNAKGLQSVGFNPDQNQLIEVVELADHPWFIGVQFHPEFLSSPLKVHPLFNSFIKTMLDQSSGDML